MAIVNLTSKRVQINKANATVVALVSVATFLAFFSIFACKALLSQRSYQAKLISKQQTARNTLRDNIKAEESLVAQYKQFVAQSPNLIGGNPKGTGDRDGDNARIILDALPSKYDFPALASSLEKLASANGTPIVTLTGVDDEVNQQQLASQANAPASVEMPFQMAVSGNFDSIQKMIDTFQRSIRPISINTMTVVGKDSQLMLTVNAKTYYQPDAGLRITTEVVK